MGNRPEFCHWRTRLWSHGLCQCDAQPQIGLTLDNIPSVINVITYALYHTGKPNQSWGSFSSTRQCNVMSIVISLTHVIRQWEYIDVIRGLQINLIQWICDILRLPYR